MDRRAKDKVPVWVWIGFLILTAVAAGVLSAVFLAEAASNALRLLGPGAV
jgi:hypothetical protein